jgi:hypothetical protein
VWASYDGAHVVVERRGEVVPGFAGRWEVASRSAEVDVVADTYSVEMFTSEGRSLSLHSCAIMDASGGLPE